MELKGASAIVTGGESGIGRASAIALAKAGANVTLTYFADAVAGQDTVAEIEKSGVKGLAVKCDVGNEDNVEALFASAEAAFGPVRLLVNSAGLIMPGIPFA
jgi:glucose 1-dehydrogenase